MKAVKKVLDFSNEITFYGHYNIERVLKLNHVRDCVNNLLSKSEYITKEKII